MLHQCVQHSAATRDYTPEIVQKRVDCPVKRACVMDLCWKRAAKKLHCPKSKCEEIRLQRVMMPSALPPPLDRYTLKDANANKPSKNV